MGREVRRVPIDFAWPLDKVWEGFLNPHLGPLACLACDQTGYNPETRQIADSFYDSHGFGQTGATRKPEEDVRSFDERVVEQLKKHGCRWTYDYNYGSDGQPASRPPWRIIGDCRRWDNSLTQDEVDMLVAEGRLHDLDGSRWNPEIREWVKPDPAMVVTPEMVAEWNERGFGHDAINRHLLVRKRAERYGVYGECDRCHGAGHTWWSDKAKVLHEGWEPQDPPHGDAWQLWETVTEGSPISPVFATSGQLVDWLVDSEGYGRQAATQFVAKGWAPSGVVVCGEFHDGIEAAGL